MSAERVSTQSLVAFLERSDPSAIRKLRVQHPGEGRILSSAGELGAEDAAEVQPASKAREFGAEAAAEGQPVPIDPARRAALIDLVHASIGKLRAQMDGLMVVIRGKMQLVTRTKLAGGTVATLSGAIGAVLAVLKVGEPGTAVASAVIAMLGGLATLFADYFERAPSGMRIASAEEHGRLIEMRGDLERMERRLSRDPIFSLSDQDLEQIVKTLDDYAARVVQLSYA